RLEESQTGALTSLLNRFRPRSESPVLITGEDGVLVSYARCCAPLPGELVVGFITRGRGITVHRNTCKQLKELDADRRIPVQWAGGATTRHSGEIHIYCDDRPGMLANISKICEQNHVNIQCASATGINEGSLAVCTLAVEVRDVNELSRLIRHIQQIKGVDSVERTLG
ncbi:MAG: GTP pyrophosphokinase, partial [Rhodobacterales bacterium]|nr:GTP pyrophosphokinase [Rhodobacterales bacterium]